MERGLRTALNLTYWQYVVSLLILPPQNFWVVFCVRGIRFYPQESFQISLFICLLPISRGVTLVILHQIDSRIAHHRPRCHLITFGSYCSVISILTTLTGKPLFQKSLMIQYTNKKPYESSLFFTYYVTKCNSVVLFPGENFKSLICIHTIFSPLYYIIIFVKEHFIIWCFLPFYPTLHH